MTLTVSDLSTYYSAMTTTELWEQALWPSLCNRMWEGELQGQNKVVIQDPSYNTEPRSRNRGDDFRATSDEVEADQITLTINHRAEQNTKIDREDVDESPIDWLSRIAAS